jgi:uncharacterized protein YbaP (TraB family)
LAEIAQDWVIGDVEALEATLVAPLAGAPEGYVQSVLLDRNQLWADRLDRFMQGSGTGFVAIGTAHLLGEGSVIDALEARDYDVARYLAFLGDDVIKPTRLTLPEVPSGAE